MPFQICVLLKFISRIEFFWASHPFIQLPNCYFYWYVPQVIQAHHSQNRNHNLFHLCLKLAFHPLFVTSDSRISCSSQNSVSYACFLFSLSLHSIRSHLYLADSRNLKYIFEWMNKLNKSAPGNRINVWMIVKEACASRQASRNISSAFWRKTMQLRAECGGGVKLICSWDAQVKHF